MKIIVDENNPYAEQAFSTLGEVTALPAAKITREALRDSEILACRSTIRVNADLLEETAVRCVATATIGTDHFDVAYLDRAGIRWYSAPGSNADSVADYFTAALLSVAQTQGAALEGRTLGVIGCGNVGSRVARRAQALGMRVLENDPPLARQTGQAEACTLNSSGDPRYRPLDDLFAADYITLHTPLTREGPDATHHLVNEAFLRRMRPGAVLINTARGAVVNGTSLKAALRGGRIAAAVLDVWEGEPSPDPELAELAFLATPHVAGHSFDGKVAGAMQIYRQVCEYLGRKPTFDPAPLLPPPDVPEIVVDAAGRADEDLIREVVLTVYPIRNDDTRFREVMALPSASERSAGFAALRTNYPRRREFSWTRVLARNPSETLLQKLRGLSFQAERV
jgi:erythronate-4-phosphate dehydrogenase